MIRLTLYVSVPKDNGGPATLQAVAAVAEKRCGSEALALRLAVRVTMLAAQQNRESLDRVFSMGSRHLNGARLEAGMKLAFWRRPSVSVLTWNVWFGLEKPVKRWTRLLADAAELGPDLIAFQEVTDPFLEMLRNEPWVRKAYRISDPRGESISSYGSVIVSRHPILRHEVLPLDSEMDRKLVVVETEVAGSAWTVATVHLESLESATVRARQLEQILEYLGPAPSVILCGDFNFCSSWAEENGRIPREFVDVWPAASEESGFTVDTELNATRARKTDGERRERFDRIFVRSNRAQPAEVRLVGTKQVKGETPALFPSDHFGVYGRLALERA
jgi:tyrosyl-DNA phosphodiesterase 2